MHNLITSWFFAATGLMGLAVLIMQIRKGPWSTKTREEHMQIIGLILWVVLSIIVIYMAFSGTSGYIYPRYFENI